jgi:hypothetical protein
MLSDVQVVGILGAFNDEEVFGDWSGATEIYAMEDDEVWPAAEMIPRGTPQQGIAVIMKVAAMPQQLAAIIGDAGMAPLIRISAIVNFAYLNYSCDPGWIEGLIPDVTDSALRAILTWFLAAMRCAVGLESPY